MKKIWRLSIAAFLIIASAIVAGVASYRFFYVDNLATVADGVLYRCGQPSPLQWNVLTRCNIRTVVNLRTEAEDPQAFEQEKNACTKAGVKLVHIPVSSVPARGQVDEFLQTILRDPPVLVHDLDGRFRCAVMTAAFRVVFNDWTVEEAMIELGAISGQVSGDQIAQTADLLTGIKARRAHWLSAASHPSSQPTARS